MALINLTGQDPTGATKPIPVAGLAKSTTSILPANASWNTGIISYNGNEAVHFAISSDVSGTYIIEYFLNGQLISFTGNPTFYDPAIVNSFQGALSGKGDSFRLTYTNGSTAQTRFYLEVRFGDDIQETLRSIGTPISSTNLGSTTHAVIEGRENGTGNYKQATLTENNGKVAQDVFILNQQSTQPVSGTVTVSNFPTSTEISNDIGNPIPVSGTLNIGNLPVTQPISGNVGVNNFPATQQVTGTVTVSNAEVQYAEDSIAVDGEMLTMAGVVRRDVASSLVSADGDRTELQVNAQGALRVETTTGAGGVPKSFNYGTSGTTSGVQTLKAGAGKILDIYTINAISADVFIQFFDTIGTVTLGTTVPAFVYAVDANVPLNKSMAATFTNGLKFAITTTYSGNAITSQAYPTFIIS
jgi:hypothetical protein